MTCRICPGGFSNLNFQRSNLSLFLIFFHSNEAMNLNYHKLSKLKDIYQTQLKHSRGPKRIENWRTQIKP